MNTPTQSPAVATHTPTPWAANESVFSTNGMNEAQLSALDEIVYRSGLIETAKEARRGFRVQGRYYFYYHDAAHAARLIALRLAKAATR